MLANALRLGHPQPARGPATQMSNVLCAGLQALGWYWVEYLGFNSSTVLLATRFAAWQHQADTERHTVAVAAVVAVVDSVTVWVWYHISDM